MPGWAHEGLMGDAVRQVTSHLRQMRASAVVWHDFHLPWWGWVAAVACVLLDASLHTPWTVNPPLGDATGIPSVFAGWVLALALARQTWRHVRRTRWAYAVLISLFLVAAGFALSAGMTPAETAVMAINAVGEELSFRVALPLLIFAVLTWILRPVPEDVRRLVAVAGAAVVFTIAPGHVEQMSAATDWLPFFGVAIVWGLLVASTGAWLAAGILHAASNLLTWSHLTGHLTGPGPVVLRLVGYLTVLVIIVLSTRTEPRRGAAVEDDQGLTAADEPVTTPTVGTSASG